MGVDYSATSGYGFAIPEEEIEELAKTVGYEFDIDWGIDAYEFGGWLTRNNSLGYEHVGDHMCGVDQHLLILASASAGEVDFRYDFSLKKLGQIIVTDRDTRELKEVYDRLYGEGTHEEGYIGWMLAMTVS